MLTSWLLGVCIISAPTTTVFVPSFARKSNQNLQVRLCGVPFVQFSSPLTNASASCDPGRAHAQQPAHGESLVTAPAASHSCDVTQGVAHWAFSLENVLLGKFGGWSSEVVGSPGLERHD